MTTEKIQNFNIDNEYIKIVRDFTYLERAVMEELWKITKGKYLSLDAKAKIIHTLIFPITMYECESWTVKRLIRKK